MNCSFISEQLALWFAPGRKEARVVRTFQDYKLSPKIGTVQPFVLLRLIFQQGTRNLRVFPYLPGISYIFISKRGDLDPNSRIKDSSSS